MAAEWMVVVTHSILEKEGEVGFHETWFPCPGLTLGCGQAGSFSHIKDKKGHDYNKT